MKRLCPFLTDVTLSKVDQFKKGHIRCKGCFVLGHLPYLPMEALYGVGSIDQPSDILGVFKVSTELVPVVFPGGNYDRVFLLPFFAE